MSSIDIDNLKVGDFVSWKNHGDRKGENLYEVAKIEGTYVVIGCRIGDHRLDGYWNIRISPDQQHDVWENTWGANFNNFSSMIEGICQDCTHRCKVNDKEHCELYRRR